MAPDATGKRKRNGKAPPRPAREPGEEELKLADSLFGGGSWSKASKRAKAKQRGSFGDFEQEGEDDGVQGMTEQYLDDDQLFMLDTAVGAAIPASAAGSSKGSSVSGDEKGSDDDNGDSEDDQEEDEDDEEENREQRANGASLTRRRKPVWTDPSSATLTVALSGPEARAVDGSRRGTNRLRKLREAPDEEKISGTEYEMRLRRMFEKLHPRPRWAALELRGGGGGGVAGGGAPSIAELLNMDAGLVRRRATEGKDTGGLPGQQLQVQRLRNANEAQGRAELPAITQLAFHPGRRADVMMTASKDRRVRLFHIDGKDNPLLQTIHVPDLTLNNAVFHPGGSTILLSGRRPFFYVHDIHAGTTYKSTPWRAFSGADEDALQARDLSLTRFSPAGVDGGRRLAVGVRRGAIHVLDWGRQGGGLGGGGGSMGGSLIGTLQMNAPLAGLTWDPAREHGLVSLSQQGTVHTWDVRKMTCEVQRTDVGLFAPCTIEAHPAGQLFAIGSQDGIVSMYGREVVEAADASLEPRKSIRNIVTTTTALEFNPTGEILGIASDKKKDTLKLAHVPSLNVFENWPTSGTPLGSVSTLGFSNTSEYLAIGNTRGKVLLYSLTHYS